eukprot:EG_transcript_1255
MRGLLFCSAFFFVLHSFSFALQVTQPSKPLQRRQLQLHGGAESNTIQITAASRPCGNNLIPRRRLQAASTAPGSRLTVPPFFGFVAPCIVFLLGWLVIRRKARVLATQPSCHAQLAVVATLDEPSPAQVDRFEQFAALQLPELKKKLQWRKEDLPISSMNRLDVYRWCCARLLQAGHPAPASWTNPEVATASDGLPPSLIQLSVYSQLEADHLDDLLCARGLSPAPQRTARIAQLLVDDITTQRPTFGLEHTGRVGEMYRQVLTDQCIIGSHSGSYISREGSLLDLCSKDLSRIRDICARLFSWAEVDLQYCGNGGICRGILSSRLTWLTRLSKVHSIPPLSGPVKDSSSRRFRLFVGEVSGPIRRELQLMKESPVVRLPDWPRPLDAFRLALEAAFQLYQPPLRRSQPATADTHHPAVNAFLQAGPVDEAALRSPQVAALNAIDAYCAEHRQKHWAPANSRRGDRQGEEAAGLEHFIRTFHAAIALSYTCDDEEQLQRAGDKALAALKRVKSVTQGVEKAKPSSGLCVLPTGVGKTAVISLSPFLALRDVTHSPAPNHRVRVLIVLPNLVITREVASCLNIATPEKCLYSKLNLLDPQHAPTVVVLGRDVLTDVPLTANVTALTPAPGLAGRLADADIVVANVQQLSLPTLLALPTDFFDLLVFDEAHHAVAQSFVRVRDHFRRAPALAFTSTPFRSDRVELPAELIYRFWLRDAIRDGYMKDVAFDLVPVESVTYEKASGDTVKLTGEDLLWAGGELSMHNHATRWREVRDSTIAHALARLTYLDRLDPDIKHRVLLCGADVQHAAELMQAWNSHPDNLRGGQEPRFPAGLVIGDDEGVATGNDSTLTLQRFERAELRCVAHVRKLGEGYDLPSISVICFFRRPGSLVPFAQSVGRAVRRLPGARHQVAYIVSHPLLCLQPLWEGYAVEDDDFQVEPPIQMKNARGRVSTLLQQQLGPFPLRVPLFSREAVRLKTRRLKDGRFPGRMPPRLLAPLLLKRPPPRIPGLGRSWDE